MSDGAEIAGSAAASANFQIPTELNAEQLSSLETEVQELCIQCISLNSKDGQFNKDLATQQLDMLQQATPDDTLKSKVQAVMDRIQDGSPGDPSEFVKEAFAAASNVFQAGEITPSYDGLDVSISIDAQNSLDNT